MVTTNPILINAHFRWDKGVWFGNLWNFQAISFFLNAVKFLLFKIKFLIIYLDDFNILILKIIFKK